MGSQRSGKSPNGVSLNNNASVASFTSSTAHIVKEEEPERGEWGNRWEFLLSCVGLSVGLGNVWRFPYLAYTNGGGAFLIPYLIMLFLVGKPMYYMELAFGQFAGQGPLSIWSCAPIAKGVGCAMLCITFCVAIYYNVLMCYTLYYIWSSFQSVVPWSVCGDWTDNDSCSTNRTEAKLLNLTSVRPASELFWEKKVLDLTDGIDNLGGIKWDVALCLLISWIIVAACLWKGIKTSGKVIYFAATFPYVILITLLIVGFTQDGAWEGAMYFLMPQMDKLLDIQVWRAAAGQMFFSLSVSMGGLIMYSSYNPFKNNVHRDAMIVSVLDTVTSIIAGLVIFTILGAMSKEYGIPIEEVVKGGPGLAFVAYPEALSRLPFPQFFSILFFLMLFILGLDSEFANLETISTCITDQFPSMRKYKSYFVVLLAIICFLLGLTCVTRGGQYVLTLMDDFGSSYPLILVAVFEALAVFWLYGINNFSDDIKFMLGKSPSAYWKLTWVVTSPIILFVIFVYAFITAEHPTYGSYVYPDWASTLGWCMTLFVILQIPLWAVIQTLRQKAPTLKQKFKMAMRPSRHWGPSDKSLLDEYNKVRRHDQFPPFYPVKTAFQCCRVGRRNTLNVQVAPLSYSKSSNNGSRPHSEMRGVDNRAFGPDELVVMDADRVTQNGHSTPTDRY